MLAHYAERLNGVELNGSFYRTPDAATLVRWAEQTPPGFRFCFKAHRGITYSAEGFDKVLAAEQVGDRLGALGPRLGPVLLQFPPVRPRDAGMLDRVLEALGLRAAVEFRNESWFSEDVYRVLRARGAALVLTDQEKWPLAPRLELAPFSYYRLRRRYDPSQLERWRRELRAEAGAREEVHVYFRHDEEGPGWACRVLA
jgi:uncharacterized protein YecE (DUF72 family)